jgi:hypothetical protein
LYQIAAAAPRRVATLRRRPRRISQLSFDAQLFGREPRLRRRANDFLDSTDYAADTNLTDTAASATRVFSRRAAMIQKSCQRVSH